MLFTALSPFKRGQFMNQINKANTLKIMLVSTELESCSSTISQNGHPLKLTFEC